jgi:hypothetical protein
MEEAMTIHLRADIAAGLSALAAAHGTSVEDYLTGLIEKELPVAPPGTQSSESASGMVWEDGLLIYGAGTPLPPGYIDNALRLSREQRSQRILGCSD